MIQGAAKFIFILISIIRSYFTFYSFFCGIHDGHMANNVLVPDNNRKRENKVTDSDRHVMKPKKL